MTDEDHIARFGLDEIARPVCWAILSPTEEKAELDRLTVWVTWLSHRYRIDRRILPDCWASHGDLVEELSALRTAWQHSYNGGARADAPAAWHTLLHTTRTRLRESVSETGCQPDRHRDNT